MKSPSAFPGIIVLTLAKPSKQIYQGAKRGLTGGGAQLFIRKRYYIMNEKVGNPVRNCIASCIYR